MHKKRHLLFLIFLAFTCSTIAFAETYEPITPERFREIIKSIKNAKTKDIDTDFLDNNVVKGSQEEAAKIFLTGKYYRKSSKFNEATESFEIARELLEGFLKDRSVNFQYPFTLKDIDHELDLLVEDEYQARPAMDEKTIKAIAARKGHIKLQFLNGKTLVNEEKNSSPYYRVLSLTKLCSSVRKIFPHQTYIVDGKTLLIEFQRATYNSKVLYDYCSEKLLQKAKKLSNDTGHPPGKHDETTGFSYSQWAIPVSVVGPLFSYSISEKSVESRVAYGESFVTLDLGRDQEAKFADWFEPESLSAPCPKTLEKINTHEGYAHCAEGGKIDQNKFAFRKLGTQAELSFFIKNFSGSESEYYSFSNGSATPNKALREVFENAEMKNLLLKSESSNNE